MKTVCPPFDPPGGSLLVAGTQKGKLISVQMYTSIKQKMFGQHSKDAARLGLHCALAAALQWSLMEALSLPERFVGVLSAVLVVEHDLGNTLVAAQHRFFATLLGCILGLVCFAMVPDHYGVAMALAVSMFVINALAAFRPEWRYGAVAAIALALRSENNPAATAIERVVAIGLGVLVGTIVSLVVWREKAATRCERYIRSALHTLADYLSSTVKASTSAQDRPQQDARSRFLQELAKARHALAGVRFADDSALRDQIYRTEQLYYSIVILEQIGEKNCSVQGKDEMLKDKLRQLQKESSDVIRQIADEKHIDSKQIAALDSLHADLQEHIQRNRSESSHPMTRAFQFGLDEMEATIRSFADQEQSPVSIS